MKGWSIWKKLGVAEAREKFSDIVEQVQYQGDTYLISLHGKLVVAVVPVVVYETWKRQRRIFFRGPGGIPDHGG